MTPPPLPPGHFLLSDEQKRQPLPEDAKFWRSFDYLKGGAWMPSGLIGKPGSLAYDYCAPIPTISSDADNADHERRPEDVSPLSVVKESSSVTPPDPAAQELDRLREQVAILQSQVDNADVNLEQVRMIEKGKTATLQAELERVTKERDEAQQTIRGALTYFHDSGGRSMVAGNTITEMFAALVSEMDDAKEARDAAIARASELASRDQWQPIETAPKTGDDLHALEILGWIPDPTDIYDGGDFEVVYWEPIAKQWFCRGNEAPTPTHWRPLPQPPTSGQEGR